MYLKSLTLLGFKSFADKTSLAFQPGVSAIVGPNGCGKSNVSDAIRWVLGEQSAKALRGGEMADVIFNGTDSRRALAMAEVSINLGDVDQDHLVAAGLEIPYNEVTVTRRVFRDGGSEYFLNKTPCRLRDIQQLFMGTGVGRASYSIMAQGNITQILSSKPEDRRLVFEEAAGITKFKAQKREALRKLEYTDQNLLRVSDLIREVKRQIGSLQRQAGKARRYKSLLIELQHLETQLARHQFDVLQAEIGERMQRSNQLRQQIERLSEGLLQQEDEIHHRRSSLSELEHQISLAQQTALELKGQIEQHNHRIHFNEERLLELENQHGKALNEIAQADERRRIAEEELGALEARLAQTDAQLQEQTQALHVRQQALAALDQELRQRQDQLRQGQSEAFTAAQLLARARNEINTLDLQKQGHTVRLEKLSAEKIQLEEERTSLETRLREFAADVQAEKLHVQSRRGTVAERQERLGALDQELRRLSEDLETRLQEQAERRSRMELLQQLQTSHEGFSAGALAALQNSEEVLGSLADRIRVPDEYITAVETALGHHLQLVLTQQPGTARKILAELASRKKGRASIAPLSLLSAQIDSPSQPGALPLEGDPFPALGIVNADPDVLPLLRGLLGQTQIAPDLETATNHWRQRPGAFDYVTPAGEVLSRHGVFTGGAANGHDSKAASLLGRKNQIEELQGQLAQLHSQIAESSRQKGSLLSEQTQLQAGLQQAQSELRDHEVAIATREGEFTALQNSGHVLRQKIDTVVYEVQSLAEQDQEGQQRRAALAHQIQTLESQEGQCQERVASLTAQLETLRQERERANDDLSETRVALATQEQLLASTKQQIAPLQTRIAELQHLAIQRREEIQGFSDRKSQWETEIADSRHRAIDLQQAREQANIQISEREACRDQEQTRLTEQEDHLRSERAGLSQLQQHRGALEVELAQKNMAVQNLRERIQQKYQLQLDGIPSECITITYADSGQPRIETLSPEDMAASGASTDWEQVAEQVGVLQTRLDEMGPVNLVAIEEYEETEQRHQFLSTQYEDLVKAKAQLLEVINRINNQTREMFLDTFNKIRDNFRSLFSEIFGGGKADLRLVDENNVLESGIDIMARPPGKQLQNISLLSGGEQTMTAVALLFSIYQVKPSPFCVLDELDAPLDESNINRFIRVLQRFLANSQFIIITHNKRTIGMADVLYGVTMQEQGVSRIVSVKFHKTEETAAPHQAVSLETPLPGPSVAAEEDKLQPTDDTLEVAIAK